MRYALGSSCLLFLLFVFGIEIILILGSSASRKRAIEDTDVRREVFSQWSRKNARQASSSQALQRREAAYYVSSKLVSYFYSFYS